MNSSSSEKLLLKASIPIVESFLSGSDFKSALLYFYRTDSPKFKDFDEDYEQQEFTLAQKECHDEFIESIESLISLRLEAFSIKVDDCYTELVSAHLTEETAKKVNLLLSRHSDFIEFCRLMKSQFVEIYESNAEEREEDAKKSAEADSESNSRFQGRNFVRVLWDLENVSIPKVSNVYISQTQLMHSVEIMRIY